MSAEVVDAQGRTVPQIKEPKSSPMNTHDTILTALVFPRSHSTLRQE
jgi:hypothetical protein